MKARLIIVPLVIGSVMLGTAYADTNVALNATVTAVSGSSLIYNPSTPLSVVTDGIFTPEETAYWSPTGVQNAVEWAEQYSGDSSVASGLVLDINLGAEYNITGAIVQADDNDSYMLQYWDSTTNSWQLLYSVPAISVGYGLRTRQTTVGPVVTDLLQFSAVGGDSGDAVSEIQVEGTLVSTATPEPSNFFLLGSGLVGLAGMLCRRRVAHA